MLHGRVDRNCNKSDALNYSFQFHICSKLLMFTIAILTNLVPRAFPFLSLGRREGKSPGNEVGF